MDKRSHRKPAAAPSGFWTTVKRILIVGCTIGAVGTFVYADVLASDYYRDEVAPTVTIHTNYGGVLVDFITKYEGWRERGRQVRVDGMCISACTLVVGMIDADHLCATPHAVFAFHSAWALNAFGQPVLSPEGTRIMWHFFPPALRAALVEKGFDAEDPTKISHPTLLYLEGEDVYQFVRKCV